MATVIKLDDDGLDRELLNQDAVLSDYFFFAIGVDGIPYNMDEALNPQIACKCIEIVRESGEKKVACWKKGIIGLIGEDEVDLYCPPQSRTFPESAKGLEQRLRNFEEASEVCNLAGANTLEERLACMSAELRARNEKLASVG